MSGDGCGNPFPVAFHGQGMVQTTRVPKEPPVLRKAFGITWIMTIDHRTILWGEQPEKRCSWIMGSGGTHQLGQKCKSTTVMQTRKRLAERTRCLTC